MDKTQMLQRCEMLVIALVGKELSNKWWSGTNLAFDGITPLQMFYVDADKVYNYLMYHASGTYS
jgi:hypothetical protein